MLTSLSNWSRRRPTSTGRASRTIDGRGIGREGKAVPERPRLGTMLVFRDAAFPQGGKPGDRYGRLSGRKGPRPRGSASIPYWRAGTDSGAYHYPACARSEEHTSELQSL